MYDKCTLNKCMSGHEYTILLLHLILVRSLFKKYSWEIWHDNPLILFSANKESLLKI